MRNFKLFSGFHFARFLDIYDYICAIPQPYYASYFVLYQVVRCIIQNRLFMIQNICFFSQDISYFNNIFRRHVRDCQTERNAKGFTSCESATKERKLGHHIWCPNFRWYASVESILNSHIAEASFLEPDLFIHNAPDNSS